jgi:hypothetical protein
MPSGGSTVRRPSHGVVHAGEDFLAHLGDAVPFQTAAVAGDVAEPGTEEGVLDVVARPLFASSWRNG